MSPSFSQRQDTLLSPLALIPPEGHLSGKRTFTTEKRRQIETLMNLLHPAGRIGDPIYWVLLCTTLSQRR
jgi:hypothetical protein